MDLVMATIGLLSVMRGWHVEIAFAKVPEQAIRLCRHRRQPNRMPLPVLTDLSCINKMWIFQTAQTSILRPKLRTD